MDSDISLALVDGEFRLEDALIPQFDLKINTSIVEHREKYYCAYRTDHMDDFDAKNFITVLDRKFNPIRHISLKAENGNAAFEDIRLFIFEDQLMALYTYLPKTGDSSWVWENGIGIARIDLENGQLVNQQSLRALATNLNEKNYVPYVYNCKLFLIANIDPRLRVIAVEGKVGAFTFKEIYVADNITEGWGFGQLRGGTPFISSPVLNDKWQYSFVHSSVYLPNGNFISRFYVYTILRYDPATYQFEYHRVPIGFSNNETVINKNPALLLKRKNVAIKVVFPMGVINYKNGLLVSYGKDDFGSRLKFYFWDYIIGLFERRVN